METLMKSKLALVASLVKVKALETDLFETVYR